MILSFTREFVCIRAVSGCRYRPRYRRLLLYTCSTYPMLKFTLLKITGYIQVIVSFLLLTNTSLNHFLTHTNESQYSGEAPNNALFLIKRSKLSSII